jgi:hypothetical protein
MGDYLSDLVIKNIGMAKVIEPRRPARFEPAQTTAALAEIEPPFRAERFEQERIIELIPPVRLRREVRLIEKNADTPRRKDSDGQIARVPPVTPPEVRPPETKRTDTRATFTPKRIETTREPNGENLPASNLSKSPTPSIAPAPAQPSPKSAKERETGNNLEENAPTRTHRALPTETNDLKTPPAKNVEPRTVEARNKIVIESRIEKAANRAEESAARQTIISPPPQEMMSKQISERAERPPTPPVINVTIGRVEVRAAVTHAPPKQASAKPQTVGLDEYLRKRRAGGER